MLINNEVKASVKKLSLIKNINNIAKLLGKKNKTVFIK